MKTVEEMAIDLCKKTGLAGAGWERNSVWNVVYDAIASARAEAIEEAAKVCDDEVADHDRTQEECKRLKFCECYGVGSIRRLAAAIRALKERG